MAFFCRYFSPAELSCLLTCFKKSWHEAAAEHKVRQELLQFVRQLAKDDRDGKVRPSRPHIWLLAFMSCSSSVHFRVFPFTACHRLSPPLNLS